MPTREENIAFIRQKMAEKANAGPTAAPSREENIAFIRQKMAEQGPQEGAGGVVDKLGKAHKFIGGISRTALSNTPVGQAVRFAAGDKEAFNPSTSSSDFIRSLKGDAPTGDELIGRTGEPAGSPIRQAGGVLIDAASNPVNTPVIRVGGVAAKGLSRAGEFLTRQLPGGNIAASAIKGAGKGLGKIARIGDKGGKAAPTTKAAENVSKSGGLLGESTGKAVVTSGKAIPKTSRGGLLGTAKKTPKPRAKIPNVPGKKMTKSAADKFAEVVKRRSDKFQSARANAKDFESLVQVGKKRGMKKPEKWATHVLKGRKTKIEKRIKEAETALDALKGK